MVESGFPPHSHVLIVVPAAMGAVIEKSALAGTQANVTFTFTATAREACPLRVLKRTQEIQDILPVHLRQPIKKSSHNSICLGP